MRSVALLGAIGLAGAFHAPAVHRPRTVTLHMQEAEAPDLSSFFEEEEPITWASPEWQWGSSDGESHKVAERVREELEKQYRRSLLVTRAKLGSVDFFDLKMALALMCQQAGEQDSRWATLLEEMVAAKYEADGFIEQQKLADAVNAILANPIEDSGENPAAVLAAALEELDFSAKGFA
jgi:hypothetical protein